MGICVLCVCRMEVPVTLVCHFGLAKLRLFFNLVVCVLWVWIYVESFFCLFVLNRNMAEIERLLRNFPLPGSPETIDNSIDPHSEGVSVIILNRLVSKVRSSRCIKKTLSFIWYKITKGITFFYPAPLDCFCYYGSLVPPEHHKSIN